ncbi:MAG: hypothetical protein HFI69_03985 [Lachnospiraceae bacterium]|nr:hypothetical protein [Lachnospiraceae bacterium]
MKKRTFAAGAAVLAVIAAALAWSYPLWHTAYLICSLVKSESIGCQIQVALEQERLSNGQKQFLQTLSWILGIEETDCFKWRAEGTLFDSQGYAQLYCDAFKEPLTELYFSEGSTLVNIRMLYQRLQENFTKEHPLLGTMLPDWKYGAYISLEQIEELFQADLKELFQGNASASIKEQSLWKNLLMLKSMKRQKTRDGDWQFQTIWNHYGIALKTGKSNEGKSFAEVRGVNGEKSRQIKSFVFLFSSEEEKAIEIPDSVMKTEEIRQFQKLWQVLKGFTEGRK